MPEGAHGAKRPPWTGIRPKGPRRQCPTCEYWVWPSEVDDGLCPECGDQLGPPATKKAKPRVALLVQRVGATGSGGSVPVPRGEVAKWS